MDGNENNHTANPEGDKGNSEANQAGQINSGKIETSTPYLDEAKRIAKETKEATEALKKENDRREKLLSEGILGGESGGNVPTKQLSPEQAKIEDAKNFWKGTSIGDDIKRANE